jgi:hypothetical protein
VVVIGVVATDLRATGSGKQHQFAFAIAKGFNEPFDRFRITGTLRRDVFLAIQERKRTIILTGLEFV